MHKWADNMHEAGYQPSELQSDLRLHKICISHLHMTAKLRAYCIEGMTSEGRCTVFEGRHTQVVAVVISISASNPLTNLHFCGPERTEMVVIN